MSKSEITVWVLSVFIMVMFVLALLTIPIVVTKQYTVYYFAPTSSIIEIKRTPSTSNIDLNPSYTGFKVYTKLEYLDMVKLRIKERTNRYLYDAKEAQKKALQRNEDTIRKLQEIYQLKKSKYTTI